MTYDKSRLTMSWSQGSGREPFCIYTFGPGRSEAERAAAGTQASALWTPALVPRDVNCVERGGSCPNIGRRLPIPFALATASGPLALALRLPGQARAPRQRRPAPTGRRVPSRSPARPAQAPGSSGHRSARCHASRFRRLFGHRLRGSASGCVQACPTSGARGGELFPLPLPIASPRGDLPLRNR